MWIVIPIVLLLIGGVLLLSGVPPAQLPSLQGALGNILVGAALTLTATSVVEQWKRNRLKKDLAVAIYHELATRVARCCVDFDKPWSEYWKNPVPLSRFTVRKFRPEPGTIFDANADKLALFETNQAAALIEFYFRLGVVRRDIDNLSDEPTESSGLGSKAIQMIASRFAASLDPGLKALNALATLVPDHASIETAALEAIAKLSSTRDVTGTLRQWLAAAIKKADEFRRKIEK